MDELSKKIVSDAVETPVAVILERCKEVPREQVVEKIQALAHDLLRLQYTLREYSVAEWYEKELDDERRQMHDVFEEGRDMFKKQSNGKNWLIMSSVPFPSDVGHAKEYKEKYYFVFAKTQNDVQEFLKRLPESFTNHILCVPLFHAQ